MLHTFTPDSDLANSGKARRLVYAWGGASVPDLQKAVDAQSPGQFVAVSIDDVWDGLRLGTARFFDIAQHDEAIADCINQKGLSYFWFVRPS